MPDTFSPRDAAEVRDVVAWAAGEAIPLEVIGRGTKRTLGRPVQAAHVLDLSNISGVELYEPAELVLTVRTGTPLAEVEALLAEANQELAFEPIDYGPLLGTTPGTGTVGGVIGCNLSGPRRIKVGAARDHILGLEAVSGRGELFKSGGRVVKNVTGYDLPRALCGSYGTLAVATSVTLKTLPRAETEATLMICGLAGPEAVSALTQAMGSSAEVSGAAHLPEAVARRLSIDGINLGRAATLLRLEGFGPSVDYRFEALRMIAAPFGPVERIDAAASKDLWRAVRDVMPFAGDAAPVWRVSVAPTAGPVVVADVRRAAAVETIYDWSCGLLWLRMTDGDPCAEALRAAIERAGGGHATLVRGDAALRTAIAVFEPQPPALAALSARLKQQFDPAGILNPGRMVAGL